MAVLDPKVWMSENESVILFEHYEKATANKEILHSQSAQSASCKRNVHIQEVLRRMFNTSGRLDWQSYGAPCLTNYMYRMKQAGYEESYRKNVLQHM